MRQKFDHLPTGHCVRAQQSRFVNTTMYCSKDNAKETNFGLDNTGGDGEQKDSYPLPSEQAQMERDKQGDGESN